MKTETEQVKTLNLKIKKEDSNLLYDSLKKVETFITRDRDIFNITNKYRKIKNQLDFYYKDYTEEELYNFYDELNTLLPYFPIINNFEIYEEKNYSRISNFVKNIDEKTRIFFGYYVNHFNNENESYSYVLALNKNLNEGKKHTGIEISYTDLYHNVVFINSFYVILKSGNITKEQIKRCVMDIIDMNIEMFVIDVLNVFDDFKENSKNNIIKTFTYYPVNWCLNDKYSHFYEYYINEKLFSKPVIINL